MESNAASPAPTQLGFYSAEEPFSEAEPKPSTVDLGYLCGSGLKIRAHVADLDDTGLVLVAVVVLDSVFERLALDPTLDRTR